MARADAGRRIDELYGQMGKAAGKTKILEQEGPAEPAGVPKESQLKPEPSQDAQQDEPAPAIEPAGGNTRSRAGGKRKTGRGTFRSEPGRTLERQEGRNIPRFAVRLEHSPRT